MITATQFVILSVFNLFFFTWIGFYVGKYYERKAWNDLIAIGVIPTPNKRG